MPNRHVKFREGVHYYECSTVPTTLFCILKASTNGDLGWSSYPPGFEELCRQRFIELPDHEK